MKTRVHYRPGLSQREEVRAFGVGMKSGEALLPSSSSSGECPPPVDDVEGLRETATNEFSI